jgi:hypothetical protein
MDLDWQNAPKADRAKAHELLSYLGVTVLDYDYLVKAVAALVAAERAECARLIEGHEELGEARLVIAGQIRQRNLPR